MPDTRLLRRGGVAVSSLTLADALVKSEVIRRVAAGKYEHVAPEDLEPRLRDTIAGRDLDIAKIVEAINAKMRLENARAKIIKHWQAQGGPASPLGLPLDDAFPVEAAGGGYLVPFRGGSIHIDGNLNTLNNDLAPACRLTFEGLILHSRQETSPDEIYGAGGYRVGSILMGNQVMTGNFIVPEVRLGGKDSRNTRVWPTSQEIYRGPPVGLELFIALREHDSGDRQEVRNKVKAIIDEGAKNVAVALGAGVAGSSLAQVGRTGEQIGQSTFGQWLSDAAADFITDFFGLSDDPYNPGGISITAEEMMSPPPLAVAGHNVDNKKITYTHKIDMSGTDDSGAVGHCSAYFRLWR